MAVELEFRFPLPQGLHARPAGRIQESAERFAEGILWTNLRNGRSADAKSALSLIGTDTQHLDPCRIRVEGPAEETTRSALRALVLDELPKKEDEVESAPPPPLADLPRVLAGPEALYFHGLPAGPGIARGPVVFADPAGPEEVEMRPPARSPLEERDAFLKAGAALEAELIKRREELTERTERAVIDAHLSILRDRAFAAKVVEIIAAGEAGAAAAVARAGRLFSEPLKESRSAYIRERVADVRDICGRLVALLAGARTRDAEFDLKAPAILAAEDLTPSRFLALDRSKLLGLMLESAGVTSHTLILCRARGIPAVTGCSDVRRKLAPGEEIILDGGRGLVVPTPSAAVGRYFEREIAAEKDREASRREKGRRPGRTSDGRRVEIAANIGDPEELSAAWDRGAEGVGLFRTELMLMGRPSAPGEEEQYALYSRLARQSGGRPIIVRTFDIGGDKPLPFLSLPAEANPFLGYRGIRIYDQHEDLIGTQLRALLRAAALGPLKIMFPMVAVVDEIVRMRERVAAAAAELARSSTPHRPDVELGMMVEVPSAALLIDRFSEHVDFFSVGSNDLLQYFFAADRGNPSVRQLGRPLHPAFLRLLGKIVADAHARGKWVGLCGEIAASRRVLPLLVGLGFDELSMSAAAIPEIKDLLGSLDGSACARLAEAAAGLSRCQETEELLDALRAERPAEPLIEAGLVGLRSDSRSKAEALQELARILEAVGRAGRRADVERALWAREDTFSTGIGFGVAIPHCQTNAVLAPTIAVLRFETPIEWGSSDGELVDLAILLAIPEAGPAREHLKLLARLSRRIVHEEFRADLRAAGDAAAVAGLILTAVGE